MKKFSFIKVALSTVAIISNVVLFCLLLFVIYIDPPHGLDIFIPIVFGLFFILNVVAITLTFGAYKSVATLASSFTRGSIIRFIGFVLLLLAGASFGFWLGLYSHDQIMNWRMHKAEQTRIEKYSGKQAPDFIGQTPDGTEWRLQEHLGKVVLIDFWATWCGPCVSSMPKMKEMYEKYKSRDDFVMVGISLDRDKQVLVEFCREQGIAWPQLFEDNKGWENSVARAYEIRGVPSVWIINKKGNVIGMNIHSAQVDEIERIIEESLNKSANSL